MSVIPLAAMLVHHCVDEDGMVCIEMHAPTIREMAIAAKDEHDSLRARIAELEAMLVPSTVEDIARVIDADGAQKARAESLAAERDAERARAEKAEAKMYRIARAFPRLPDDWDDLSVSQRAEWIRGQVIEARAKHAVTDALLAEAVVRAEKAEAEYNAAYQTVLHLSGALGEAQGEADAIRAQRDRLQERLDQFSAYGAETVAEMLDQRQTLIDQRDRYRDAIVEYISSKDVHRELRERWAGDMPRVRVEAAERHSSAAAALRRIAEEKP